MIARIHLLGLADMPARTARRRKTPKIQRREPRQSRAVATVDAVLEATARIVRREGLAGLNTNKVAERTGISVGTLYGYFPDKTAIVVALARRILQEDEATLVAAVDGAGPEGPIRSVVRALIARHRVDPALRRAVMSVHIGEGLGGEHSDRVEKFIAELAGRTPIADLGDLPLFVATRAVLGIVRALTEENAASRFSDAEIEAEVMRLVAGYVTAAAAPSPASPAAMRRNS
jgi:AcrR family transcriptional regulator